MIKVSDYIIKFISSIGVKHVFTVSGAGDLHLLNSIDSNKEIQYICNHHEQASAMAAYAYSRATKNIGVCVVTTGPGATNAITGMIDCWVDSVPGIYISGQVQRKYLIGNLGIRQNGIQEINIIDIVKPITKYAVRTDDPLMIKYELEKAYYIAKSGRPGPVWLDVPMDVQSAMVNENDLKSFVPPADVHNTGDFKKSLKEAVVRILNAERPLLLLGHGIKAAGAEEFVSKLLEALPVPVCVSWNGIDLLESDHPLYVGRFGIYGQRGANFAVQNCDCFISIGARLNITQTGYVYSEFAREAVKIIVDVDSKEIEKLPIPPEYPFAIDAKLFIEELINELKAIQTKLNCSSAWLERARIWSKKYPTNLPEYEKQIETVNSFTLADKLTQCLEKDDVIIPTASGSGFTSFHQAANVKKGQMIFTSNGFAEMGFDIPGAIGASIATGKQIWQITGDGGIQMNLQELQTLVHYQLPVRIFINSNKGYLTIRQTQNGVFNGKYSGSSNESGVTLPDFESITSAYGIKFFRLTNHNQIPDIVNEMKEINGPCICEVIMDPNQPLVPKTSFKIKPDGSYVSPPIEDLFPFLERDEFMSNMIVKPLDQ